MAIYSRTASDSIDVALIGLYLDFKFFVCIMGVEIVGFGSLLYVVYLVIVNMNED